MSPHLKDDALVWKEFVNGNFSVKLAYIVSKCMHGSLPLDSASRDAIWKLLWSTIGDPKVWSFYWYVLHDIFPVSANLKARHFDVFDVCCICNEHEKSVHHVLKGCRLNRSSWSIFAADLTRTELTFVFNCTWLKFFNFWLQRDIWLRLFTWDDYCGIIEIIVILILHVSSLKLFVFLFFSGRELLCCWHGS